MKHLVEYSLLENVNLAKKILNDLNIPSTNPSYVKLRDMLKNNIGFIGIFTKFLFVDKLSLDRLQKLYDELKEKKPYLGKLSKNISQYKNYEELTDDLDKINLNIRFNKVIQELPSKLKNDARQSEDYYNIIISMKQDKLEEYMEFIKKKSSGYNNIKSFLAGTKNFLGEYDIDTLIYIINNTEGAKLEYNKDNVVIAWIQTEQASERLGSESWCITTRGMWSTYNRPELFTKQYFLWNFNVDVYNNDFMLGTTIELSGEEKTSHLKDDTRIVLKKYLDKYKIDKNLLGPLNKENAIEYYRKFNKISFADFKSMIKFGIWQEFVDKIPDKWRINSGLYLPKDKVKGNMNKIQKILFENSVDKARKFVESGHSIPNFIDALRFMDIFGEELTDDNEKERAKLGNRLLSTWLKNIENEVDGAKSAEYEADVYNTNSDYIKISMDRDDDLYYNLFDVDQYVVNAVETDGESVDITDDIEYFYSYLDDKSEKLLKQQLSDYYQIELDDIEREKWYETIEEIDLDGCITDFSSDIDDLMKDAFKDDCRKAEKKIIFKKDYYIMDSYLTLNIETLMQYAIENDLYNLKDILNSEPHKISDIVNSDSLSAYNYNDVIDTTEANEKFRDKLKDAVEESFEDYGITKDFLNRLRTTADKHGFKSGYYENKNYEFNINMKKYSIEDNTVEITIKDKVTGKTKNGYINIDDLGTFISNRKFDFYFEKWNTKFL